MIPPPTITTRACVFIPASEPSADDPPHHIDLVVASDRPFGLLRGAAGERETPVDHEMYRAGKHRQRSFRMTRARDVRSKPQPRASGSAAGSTPPPRAGRSSRLAKYV